MAKGTLLIVDDEPDIVERLKLILEDYAENVLTATNGVEALQVVKDNEVHCIVCDINMPKMNGVEVIRNIRADGIQTPFVFYTAHGNKDLMLEAIKYGAFDFLNKPNLEGLEDVVSRGLSEGFTTPEDRALDEANFISEYRKMLLQMDLGPLET